RPLAAAARGRARARAGGRVRRGRRGGDAVRGRRVRRGRLGLRRDVRPPGRATAELARVVRGGGRIAITTWPPRGPVFEAILLLRRAIARVRPPEGPPPVDWGDPAVLERLLGPYGELEITEHDLGHEDTTPEQIWDRWERSHPIWIGARRLLAPA